LRRGKRRRQTIGEGERWLAKFESLQAKMLTEGEARRVAVNIAKLSELLGEADRD
jgi:hypothetical protein